MKAHQPSTGPWTTGRIGRKAAARRSTPLGLSNPGDREVEQSGKDITPEIAQRGDPGTRSRAARPSGARLAVVGQLDSKNRLSLPKAVRDAIHVGPGDSVFLNVEDEHGDIPMVRVVKAVNPLAVMLDALAEDALREHHAGETIDFDQLMDELEAEQEPVNRTDVI